MSSRIGITAAVEKVAQAAASLTDFNSQGFVADEEDFTSRLLDRIAQAFQEPVGGRYR